MGLVLRGWRMGFRSTLPREAALSTVVEFPVHRRRLGGLTRREVTTPASPGSI